MAYSVGGTVSQTVGATSVAGATYTLTVDVGYRSDNDFTLPTEELIVGGVTTDATGTAPTIGNWAAYTATYTAPTSGLAISIDLVANAPLEADWDNVSLTDNIGGVVPELSTWVMMLAGFAGLAGVALRRRRAVAA